VVVRRTQFELRKAEERAHILEGYRIALDHIDEIVDLIKKSESPATAKVGLIERFGLTEVQAQAILDLRLARLTGLERQKIEDEYKALLERIAGLKAILDSRELVLQIIREELLEVKNAYGDDRRTEVVDEEVEFDVEDLIADEEMVVTLSNQGYVKRIPLDTYRRQGRGGRGITAMQTKEQDFIDNLFVCSTHDYLLVLTERGSLFWVKVHRLPQGTRAAKGRQLVHLIRIEPSDHVTAVVPVREFREDQFLSLATSKGIIKRTPLVEFGRPRPSGIKAIRLLEDERLVSVRVTDGKGDIIIASSSGLVIKFPEEQARPMGRPARGVKGISLREGEEAIGMVVIKNDGDQILAITENGYGKRTPVGDYRRQTRGGKGILTVRCTEKNGRLVAIRNVKPGEEMMVISRNGILIRVAIDTISTQGRNTQGVKVINIGEGDCVAGVAKIATNGDEGETGEKKE
jgi:DNA gyrase subunit A